MKIPFSWMKVAAAATLLWAGHAGAAVMDDCEMLFMGGDDYNGNGCFDDGELRDRLHPGTSTDLVKKAWDFPSDCITWTNMDVQCCFKSNVLQNQKCLYFHQKSSDGGTLKDVACALALPGFGYPRGQAGYDFTVLLRIRLPDADRKADGSVLSGSDITANSSAATLAAIGNDRTSGGWTGTDLRIPHNPAKNYFDAIVQNWSKGTTWTVGGNTLCTFTNAVSKTRDASWIEVAVTGNTWTYNNAPAPGTRIRAKTWDGAQTTAYNGGRNGAPVDDKPFLLGNNDVRAAAGGFQGAVHMVAAWRRELSEAEIESAFKFLAGPSDTLAHDGTCSGLYKYGYDESNGSLFGGPAGVISTIPAPDRFASNFPSNFTAGTRLPLRTPLDAFTKNMKQVLRLRTASDSATGTLSVKANGATLASALTVSPSKTYLYTLPESFFAGDELTVELACASAGVGGVRFATVEVGGSWTVGLKDNSTTQIVPGKTSTANSRVREFTVGTDPMTSFPTYCYDYERNRDRSYTDIRFFVPEGLDRNFQYVFRGSIRGGFIHPTYGFPLEYILNGTKHSEMFRGTSVNDGRDYAMTIDAGDLNAGWNTLRCQNYMTNVWNGATASTGVKSWCYTYWDYVSLQIEKRVYEGTVILLR